MNYIFTMANIINSKLALFSSRYVAKVVLDGSSSTSSDGNSFTTCVDRLRSWELVLVIVLALDLNLPVIVSTKNLRNI